MWVKDRTLSRSRTKDVAVLLFVPNDLKLCAALMLLVRTPHVSTVPECDVWILHDGWLKLLFYYVGLWR